MSDFELCKCNPYKLDTTRDAADTTITITIPQVEGISPKDVKTFLEMVNKIACEPAVHDWFTRLVTLEEYKDDAKNYNIDVVVAEKPSQLLTSRRFPTVYDKLLNSDRTSLGYLEVDIILDYPLKTRMNIIMESNKNVDGKFMGIIRNNLCEYFQMCRVYVADRTQTTYVKKDATLELSQTVHFSSPERARSAKTSIEDKLRDKVEEKKLQYVLQIDPCKGGPICSYKVMLNLEASTVTEVSKSMLDVQGIIDEISDPVENIC